MRSVACSSRCNYFYRLLNASYSFSYRKCVDSHVETNLTTFSFRAPRLTGDVQWPAWTPFSTALGPLAGSFPLLSLRTNKADVVVGVERETAEKLDGSGSKWRVDGR